MKLKNLVAILILSIFILSLPDSGIPARNYIIQLETAAVNQTKLHRCLAGYQGEIIQSYAPDYSEYRWYEIRLPQPGKLPGLIKKLRREYRLAYVAPATPVQSSATANDPYFLTGQQNYFKRLGIEAAWNSQAGNDRVKVAVIDTGIDSLHPDINNIFLNKKEIPFDSIDNDNNGYVDDIRGWNFINNNNYTDDDNGHGTHVAGIIGATTNNQIGIAGAAGGGFEIDGKKRPGVVLIPLKTANKRNQHGSNIVIAKAVDLAVNYGASIINLSLQTTATPPIEKDPLYQSLARAARQGVVLIAASGNTDDAHYANLDNWSHYNLLTNHPDVIAVTATEVIEDGRVKIADWKNSAGKSVFACYGASVEVGAPGKDILSTITSSDRSKTAYGRYSGTSMAAAVVSGAASLILSKNFRLKPRHVRKILEGSATPLFVYGGGSGEINFERALLLTPAIQEPFIAINRQLLRGFPKGYRQRGRKIIGLSSQLLKKLDEDSFYDMRIALLIDFYQKKWLRGL